MSGLRVGTGCVEFLEHFEEGFGENAGGVFLNVVGAEPRFVAAEAMLFNGGKVAMATVGEADDDGVLEGATLFEFEAHFDEGLERDAAERGVANADGLQFYRERLVWAFCCAEGAMGVVLSEARELFDGVLCFYREEGLCLGDVFFGGAPVFQGNIPLGHGDLDIASVALDFAEGGPCGVGGFLSDDTDLFEGLAWGAGDAEGDIVDIAGGSVGEHGDEVGGVPDAGGEDARELAEVVGRDLRLW